MGNKPMFTTSIPSLIAWLSLCLLAAAWGHALDSQWQIIWAEIGAFGLASAVGLGALEKTRAARAERVYNRVMQTRVECGLARLNEHSAAVDSINTAVRRLAEHAAKRRSSEISSVSRVKRHWQTQLLSDTPLEIVPVEDQDEPFDSKSVAPITGALRQISSQGVTFEHEAPFAARIVLLTFKLTNEEISFVVDVMWSQKTVDGYTSGGTVLAVGIPASPAATQAKPELTVELTPEHIAT
jgi:hypothetical protein